MRSAFVVALVVMASACGKKGSPPSAGSGSSSGSAAGSANPWSKPAAPPVAAPCDDADIKKHIDDSLSVSLPYLTALEKKAATWKQDCEAAKKDLLALEPEATKFMAAMTDFITWGKSLSPECGKRVSELGEQSQAARDIEQRTPGLEAKVKPMLERCKDHPGFQDAAAKGLRVMHTKKPAP